MLDYRFSSSDLLIHFDFNGLNLLIGEAGFETKISKDIDSVIWSKLIINVGINALTAITRLNNGKLIEFEGTRRIMREAVTEAIRIAKMDMGKKPKIMLYPSQKNWLESLFQGKSASFSSRRAGSGVQY